MVVQATLSLFGSFFVLLLAGVPISAGIGIASVVTALFSMPADIFALIAAQRCFSGLDSFSLLALPFFTLGGNIMNKGGIARRLIRLARLLVGKIPGYLAATNVLANMFFGAVSGSSVAATSAMGSILSPLEAEEGYDPNYSAAVNICSAPTGILIPPSGPLILYSITAGGVSVAALFMGGVVSFADLQSAAWFSLPRPFYFGLEFHPDAILMMILMYMVQAVQTIGDVSSTAMGGFGRQCTDQELGGAIKGQGICGMIGACIGGLPTDPYSQNVGLICTTKVVARRVFTIVGVIMLAAGIFPKFSGLMATIPQPVLGGATVTVFAAITMSGIQLLNEQPLNYRNRMIVGIALALGLGIDAAPEILQFVPQLLRNLFGSSLVVSFLVVFLLNIIIPADDSADS